MGFIRKVFVLLVLLLIARDQLAVAQTFFNDSNAVKPANPFPAQKPKKPKPIRKEWSLGGRMNTDGWSAFLDIGRVRSEETRLSDRFYNIRLLQFELTEHKHIKETKTQNNVSGGTGGERPNSFVFGKVNNFYALKFGYGKRRMIAGKPEQGTVSIHLVYLGGLSIGMEKPYYIDAYVPQDNPSGVLIRESIKFDSDKKSSFLAKGNIIGSSGWSKGLSETKIVPGLHGRVGLHFDFSTSKNTILALETGVAGELYSRNIVLMAYQNPSALLLNGYVSMQFGKRK